jgi:hypothetical protein
MDIVVAIVGLAMGIIVAAYIAQPLVGKPLPELQSAGVELPADANDRMLLVCLWDVNQRPSRHCVSQLVQQAAQLRDKGVLVVALQAAKTKITLVLIGPVTNAATALKRCPQIKEKIERFVVMGGSLYPKEILKKEGWTAEALEFENYMRDRSAIWQSLPYPFGSEMPGTPPVRRKFIPGANISAMKTRHR